MQEEPKRWPKDLQTTKYSICKDDRAGILLCQFPMGFLFSFSDSSLYWKISFNSICYLESSFLRQVPVLDPRYSYMGMG